jgi:hypothetical protein
VSTSASAAPGQRASLPWPVAELVRLYALNAVAIVALIGAWWGASGTVRNSAQVLAIAVGVGAVIVSGSANAIWLLVGRRAVAARRVAVRSGLEDVVTALNTREPVVAETTSLKPAYVTLESATRYHRRTCDLVIGKRTIPWSPQQPDTGWRTPCGVCQP